MKSESEVVQSCPTLCDPVDYSPPGSSTHGIFQARILEWVAISFSKRSSRQKKEQVQRLWDRSIADLAKEQQKVQCDTMEGDRKRNQKVKSLSRVRLFATLWTVAHQAPPSMGFSRRKYWSGLPFLSPGDIPNPGIKPRYPILQAASLPLRY